MKNDLLAKKEEKYLRELVPRLSRYQPGQWIAIADIANEINDFIDTVQRLCDAGYFLDKQGYCIIDVKEDAFVRINPEYLRSITPGFKIWKLPRL